MLRAMVVNRFCPRLPSNLMFLPFLQGMGGTPDVRPDATGSILGLTTSTRLPDIYRAILEGITYEICCNKEFFTKSGIKFDKLFACGGGARSAVWLQIKADILGCDIKWRKIKLSSSTMLCTQPCWQWKRMQKKPLKYLVQLLK